MKKFSLIALIGFFIVGLTVACSRTNSISGSVSISGTSSSFSSFPSSYVARLVNHDPSVHNPDSSDVSPVSDTTPEPTPAVSELPGTPDAFASSNPVESNELPLDEAVVSPDSTPAPAAESEEVPSKKKVALTFDDGPRAERTESILDILEQYGAKATFFVLGSSINDTTAPILQRMVDMNCEIGIHGLDHTTMTKLNHNSQVKRLNKMKEIISDRILGGYEVRLMRPPGGAQNIRVRRAALEAELSVILWSVDSADWQSQSRDKIMEVCKKKVRNGSIILMHDKLKATHAAVAELVPYLQEQGYELVTVSELFENSEEPLQPGVVYYENKSLSE